MLTKDTSTTWEKLFEIHEGQMRYKEDVHNGGWYNRAGQKIGWGDLTFKDMKKIANSIGDDFFIVVGEHDSYWDFYFPSPMKGKDELNPGIDYVMNKARYIITEGKIYYILGKYDAFGALADYFNNKPVTILTREQALDKFLLLFKS